MIENYNIEEVNKEFWDIYQEFRIQTNISREYIRYISALIYLIYYKDDSLEILRDLYIKRKNYYIGEIIDKLLDENIRYEKRDLFYNIKFREIKAYRNIGEENILSKVIERIYNLIIKIDREYYETQKYISEAYKYIIIQEMSDYIKLRRGEIYIPTGIAKVMVGCLQIQEGTKIIDPYCGTGNILVNIPNQKNIEIYGKEENQTAYDICMTSLLLNSKNNENVELNNFQKKNNLKTEFDYIISNPPFMERDLRLKSLHDQKIIWDYGKESSELGDYSYILNMFDTLSENGKMALILPHGVLFRESEKNLREHLVRKNNIECIIGLPENIFFGTRISAIIMILAKNKTEDKVMYIDASKEFLNKRKINILDKKCQERIIKTYIEKKEIQEYSHIASLDEIVENDYNLSIKKYVKKELKKQKIKKEELIKELDELEREKNILEENIKDVLEKLNIKDVLKTYETNTTYSKVDYIRIGENIKNTRRKLNCSRIELCIKLGITDAFLYRIESGRTKISLDTLVEICRALDVSIDELLGNKVERIEEKSENIFYLKNNGEDYAKGKVTKKGFVILKGSKIKSGIYESLSPSLLNFVIRERNSNSILDGEFIEDYQCTTPTMAAVLVLGRNSNGYSEWKNKDGKTLGEIIKD